MAATREGTGVAPVDPQQVRAAPVATGPCYAVKRRATLWHMDVSVRDLRNDTAKVIATRAAIEKLQEVLA